MLTTRPRSATLDDLRALEALPENAEKWFELLNGEIIEVPSPEVLHNVVIALIFYHLSQFVLPRGLGYVLGDGNSYSLPMGDVLIPDVSYISRERAGWPLPRRFAVAPELAVEVISPSNSERLMRDKVRAYLTSGTLLVWLVYPLERLVEAWTLLEDSSLRIRTFQDSDTLTADDVLPGFTLAVQDIFPSEPTTNGG